MAIERKREKKRKDFEIRRRERESLVVKEEELPLDATPTRIKYSKRSGRRMRKKKRIERERLAKKRQYFEWKTKEKESRKSGNTVTIGTDLLQRITFPREGEGEKVRTDKPKKMKTVKTTRPTRHGPSLPPSSSNSSNSDEVSENLVKRKEKKQKSSTKKQKEGKQAKNCDQPKKKKKKVDKEGQKSHQGDSPVVNTGGPTGNQSQNAPLQQAPAANGGGGGGGMNVGSAGFGGGGPQFGNGNPMNGLGNNEVPLFSFQGNPQFNEQIVSEVMQAMQVLANHNILGLGFGLGVAAMAQMRPGQESQMTANHGSAGFGDGYGGGGQGNQGGQQGDQSHWRQ